MSVRRLATFAVVVVLPEPCRPKTEDFDDAQMGCQGLRIGDGRHLAAGVQMLRKSRDARIGKRSGGGIVLVVIFQRQDILRARGPIEVGDGLIGDEICRPEHRGILRKIIRRGDVVVIGDHVLPVRQLKLHQSKRDRTHLRGGDIRPEIFIRDFRQPFRRAVHAAQSGRHGQTRNSDFLVRIVQVLVADIAEKFVLDERPAERAARGVTVQFRHFFIGRDVGVGLVEIGGGVERVGSAMQVGAAVNVVRSGGSAQVDMRAARRTLLRIVHRGIDAHFLQKFRRRRGQCLADCEVGRRAALDDFRGGGAQAGVSCVVHNASGRHRTGALAVEQIAGIHSVQQKGIARVPLAIGPDGSVAEPGVGSRAGRKLRVHSGRKNDKLGETPVWDRDRIDLLLFKNVNVGGVDGIDERGLFHRDGLADIANFQGGVHSERCGWLAPGWRESAVPEIRNGKR